jgi:hypothetical protein
VRHLVKLCEFARKQVGDGIWQAVAYAAMQPGY